MEKKVEAGSTWVVAETTKLDALTIAEGATVAAADDQHSVTMTVNGVETGLVPGDYKGKIVLEVNDANIFPYREFKHYYRQAIYMDETGKVDAKSVTSAVTGGKVTGDLVEDVKVSSVGEAFNGIYVCGGKKTLKNIKIDFKGNGGNDFAGWGSAVMGTGKTTTLVVDGADIDTKGAVRTAVVSSNGASVIVKNSDILTKNGELPAGYVPNVDLGIMKEVPWMLGLVGNCRSTNLLGDYSKSTFINSSLVSEGWGVLSTDDCKEVKLTAINCKVAVKGKSGYGAYVIGDATDSFYGCDVDVPDYAVIMTGGKANFGSSNPERVAKLNKDLQLDLTDDELKALPEKQTVVNSKRFGVMWHGNGPVSITDGTVFNCKEAVFLIKSATADINVDGSKGVQLNSDNGIILQLMENDDPGPVFEDGHMYNKGVYTQPPKRPDRIEDFDITAVNESDVKATFSNIKLSGNFYNATRGDKKPGPPPGMPEGAGPGPGPEGDSSPAGGPTGKPQKNLVLNFVNAEISGMITCSGAIHNITTITAKEYYELGEVKNIPCPPINNGVIVSLDAKSKWTVTDTSYLTALNIAQGASISAAAGKSIKMTVDGVEKAIAAGSYKGVIVITVA